MYANVGVPEGALFGVYDDADGSWAGDWFYDEESAQKAADELRDDERLGVVSTGDDETWL